MKDLYNPKDRMQAELANLAKTRGAFNCRPFEALVQSVGECRHHGDFQRYAVVLKATGVETDSSECPECVKARLAIYHKEQAEHLISVLFSVDDIGKRYEGASFASYQPTNPSAEKAKAQCVGYVKNWQTVKNNGVNLMLLGNCGTGKTHLAIAMLKALIEKHHARVKCTTAFELDRAIKATWSGKGSEVLTVGEYVA